MRREIAIHGQDLSVRYHGGSGKYALELWRRFRAGEDRSVLPGVAITLFNFAAPERTELASPARKRRQSSSAYFPEPPWYRTLRS